MNAYNTKIPSAQPIKESVRHIIQHCIANAEPPADQKELIMAALENDLITVSECFALIHVYGLGAE